MIVRPTRKMDWLADRIGNFHFSPGARAIEAVDGDQTVGMVGYDGWTQNSVQIHIALERPHVWFKLARHAFAYPFSERKLGLLIAMVSASNTRSLRLTKGVGFKETYRIRDGIARGVDFVIHEMRPEDCRWLEG